MKNRNILLTAILSLLVCGGLSCMAQSGPPTANVKVVNTPNVKVVNATTNPVPVTGTVADADNPARHAVLGFTQVTLTGGAVNGGSGISIPAGKIFVIETVSFSAFVPSGTVQRLAIQVFGTDIVTGQSGEQLSFDLVPPPPHTSGFSFGSQAMRLYAPPGTNLNVLFQVTASDPNNPPGVNVSFSGYFVSAQ